MRYNVTIESISYLRARYSLPSAPVITTILDSLANVVLCFATVPAVLTIGSFVIHLNFNAFLLWASVITIASASTNLLSMAFLVNDSVIEVVVVVVPVRYLNFFACLLRA
ncbi:MAG TPA: hypothetical protein VH796_12015 [Nitrososphaeraceae archaeon]